MTGNDSTRPTELEQGLGYVGAIEQRSGVSEVGAELYLVPFWTAEFCATVIATY